MNEIPQTLIEAVRYFADPDICNDFMRDVKWPSGVITCPKCDGESVKEIATRPGTLKCNRKVCQQQFSFKVGTIFEDSPLGLDKWFVAVWCIANGKNGISSHELSRALGVTQKTAWFMLHRIREAMKTRTFDKLQGFMGKQTVTEERKPKGWNKFDELTRKLVRVPKEEADAQQEASRKERKAKRRKKK